MVENKESNKEEELSQCLDRLNDGEHPITQDEEIKKLVDLAFFVKESYDQDELPQMLIDEVVNNLATEFQEKKKKRQTRWLYSSLGGVAAAVVIAAFTQFSLPDPAERNIAQQMNKHIDTPPIVAVVEEPALPNPSVIGAHTMTSQQVEPKEKSQEAPALQSEKISDTSVSAVLGEIMNVDISPKVEEKTTQVAALQQERPKDMVMRKSVAMEKVQMNSLGDEKKSQSAPKISKIMVMPNQIAQSTTVDTGSGEIKQVYNLGLSHHDDVVIIQGLSDESQSSKVLQPLSKSTKARMNSLTVIVGKYNIRIEGEKTGEELREIAESLIEKEITQ